MELFPLSLSQFTSRFPSNFWFKTIAVAQQRESERARERVSLLRPWRVKAALRLLRSSPSVKGRKAPCFTPTHKRGSRRAEGGRASRGAGGDHFTLQIFGFVVGASAAAAAEAAAALLNEIDSRRRAASAGYHARARHPPPSRPLAAVLSRQCKNGE